PASFKFRPGALRMQGSSRTRPPARDRWQPLRSVPSRNRRRVRTCPYAGLVRVTSGMSVGSIRFRSLGAPAGDFESVIEQITPKGVKPKATEIWAGLPPVAVEKLQENDCCAEYGKHPVEDKAVDGSAAEAPIGVDHLASTPEPSLRGRHLLQALHAIGI